MTQSQQPVPDAPTSVSEEQQPIPTFSRREYNDEDAKIAEVIFAIFMYTLRNLMRRDDILDRAQDLMVKIYERLLAGEPILHPIAFARVVARRTALRCLAAGSNGHRRTRSLGDIDECEIVDRGVVVAPAEAEQLARVQQAINQLPPQQRAALQHTVQDNKSLRESASLLELRGRHATKAVSVLRNRARQRLSRELEIA